MRWGIGASLAFLLGVATHLPAQPQSEPQTIIRATTRLVELSVVARDRSGQPVANLGKEDFVVSDEGAVQEIATFARVTAEAPGAPALPAGTLSNRRHAPRGATVLLLDALNTPALYQQRARPHIAEFLRQVGPLDRVAVYILGRGLVIMHDFTSDVSQLLGALRGYQGPGPLEGDPSGYIETTVRGANPGRAKQVIMGRGDARDLWAEIILTSFAREYREQTKQNVPATCQALEAIANRLRGIPGRKNLVWVTEGFPLGIGMAARSVRGGPMAEQKLFVTEFDRAVRALNSASVAVYPTTARGLLASGDPLVTSRSSTMEQMAARTGGRAFRREELGEVGRRVAEDVRVSYTLGFYPKHPRFDGTYRQLRVTVNRPNVTLQHRTGYFDAPEALATPEQAKAEMATAVWSPIDATGIGLEARLEDAGAADPNSRAIALLLDANTVPVEPRSGGYACRLTAVFVQKDATGKQVGGIQDELDFLLTEERLRQAQERGLTYRKLLRLRPETAAIRVVIRGAATGILGSLTIPVTRP